MWKLAHTTPVFYTLGYGPSNLGFDPFEPLLDAARMPSASAARWALDAQFIARADRSDWTLASCTANLGTEAGAPRERWCWNAAGGPQAAVVQAASTAGAAAVAAGRD